MNELVLLDGLHFFAKGEVGVGQCPSRDHIAGIELEGFREGLDRLGVFALFAEHPAQAHPRGKVRGVDREAKAKHLLCFGVLLNLPQLFG